MRKVIVFCFLLVLSCSTAVLKAQDAPPYIYYFSDVLNGIVVERADGTDSRILAQGLMPPDIDSISGPGWSPSGKWFAWKTFKSTIYDQYGPSNGYAVRVDNGATFSASDWGIKHVRQMEWATSANRNLLLVTGEITELVSDETWYLKTYFMLIDLDYMRLLAIYQQDYAWLERVGVRWSMTEGYASLFLAGELMPTAGGIRSPYVSFPYYQVKLYFNGTVMKEPISEAEWKCGKCDADYGPWPLGDVIESPSGRYRVKNDFSTEMDILDSYTGRVIHLPPHTEQNIPNKTLKWDRTEKWLIRAVSPCVAGGCEGPYARFGVSDIAGTVWRQLGGCEFNSTCIDWLPAQVDVGKMPPGKPLSVLLAPLKITFFRSDEDMYLASVLENATSTCFKDSPWRVIQLREANTRLYYLYQKTPCMAVGIPDNVAVAISPDNQLLVMAGVGRATTIWEISSGTLLTTLNTDGFRLSFSPDGRWLYTQDYGAMLVWDVSRILAQSKGN
jgi:hypothetical protein